MGVKRRKPKTNGQRHRSDQDFEEITTTEPEKSLLAPLRKRGGRNKQGRMTVRHQGGGHKRRYRIIDFKRDKDGVPARVATIEYDPNRSARIALLVYRDGEKRYIIAPDDLEVGMTVESGPNVPIQAGNCMPLENMPIGTTVHAVELKPGKGAQMARSAGTSAQLTAREGKYATLELPSGEARRVLARCKATIGSVGNAEHANVELGKAGRNRWLGARPKTRGVAMNPIDHPMGGGEGRHSGGHPRSRKGVPAKGYKTRKRSKESDKYVVRQRGEEKKG